MKLIMAARAAAHVTHIRISFARSQEVTLISQKHTQSHPDASKHEQAGAQNTHARTHTHTHNRPMFAVQGQKITCVCQR